MSWQITDRKIIFLLNENMIDEISINETYTKNN